MLMPNCLFLLCWCQIVRFLIQVPNCLFAFLVPNCPFLLSWCQIVPCQIVLPPKFLSRICGGGENEWQSYKSSNDRAPIALEKIQSQFFSPIISSFWSCQWFMSGMVFYGILESLQCIKFKILSLSCYLLQLLQEGPK